MDYENNVPAFCIIGAQKAGTSWLWRMLDKHPDTSLPAQKEIHYFGSSELFGKGDEWYLEHFRGLDSGKLIGEASTTYFFDRVPYWYNKTARLEFDESLPSIPELMSQKFPQMKFIVILRDPVHRAISAYLHWMKRAQVSPFLGLRTVATVHPKMRIVEYGLYAKYLNVWMEKIPAERFRILLFEDQIKKNWAQTLFDVYEYLGLDPAFQPEQPSKPVHRSWCWTRIVFNYYGSKVFKQFGRTRFARLLDRFDFLANNAIKLEDIEFLRSIYLPEKEAVSQLVGNELKCWDYGESML